jgi:hypothetical protein
VANTDDGAARRLAMPPKRFAAGVAATALFLGGLVALGGPAPSARASTPPSYAATEAPLPSLFAANPTENIQGESCPTATVCVAVGVAVGADGNDEGIIETLTSGKPTVAFAPLPSNAATTNRLFELRDVACPSADSCVAVGDYRDNNHDDQPLIETLTAGVWTATEAPLPADSSQVAGNGGLGLRGIACTGVGACVAVGTYSTATVAGLPLIATLAAGSWTAAAGPLPADTSYPSGGGLEQVSCPAAGSCVAIGEYSSTSNDALVDTLANGSWTSPVSGLHAPAGIIANIRAIACQSADSCVVAASYFDQNASEPSQRGFVGALADGSWTSAVAPAPANAGSNTTGGFKQLSELYGVACPAVGSCVAVGYYWDAAGHYQGLIEALAAGVWTASEAAEPSDAAPNPEGVLSAVFCSAADSCVASGEYENATKQLLGVNVTISSSGSTATGLSPSDAAANPLAEVAATSCPQAGFCVAVGIFTDTAGHRQGLIETTSDDATAASVAPLPDNAAANPAAELTDVTCISTTSCLAVGVYKDTAGHSQGLIDTMASGVWTATDAAIPANAGANPKVGQGGTATINEQGLGVTCTAVGACVVVGSYVDIGGAQQAFVDVLGSGSWTPTEITVPNGAATPAIAELSGVSCPAAGACVAVGAYDDTSNDIQPLVETLSSGVWTPSTAAYPSDVDPSPDQNVSEPVGLYRVTCASIASCVGVGNYDASDGNSYGLIDTLSDSSWTAQRAPAPADISLDSSEASDLADVSCGDGTDCVAVGTYVGTSGQHGLVETLSGGTWTDAIAALPTNIDTSLPVTTLVGIDCLTASSCVATGAYFATGDLLEGLIETQSAVPVPSITPASLPRAAVAAAYSATLSASGGTSPYSWSVSGGTLPKGLSLSSAGKLSGTPTIAGTSTFTVTVIDSSDRAATATKSYPLTVSPSITTASLPGATVKHAYSKALAVDGGNPPYSWTVSTGSLPSGLTLSAVGKITGTPKKAGTKTVTVEVTDSSSPALSATKTLALAVAMNVTPASLPNGTVGAAYSAHLTAAGGSAPYTWKLTSSGLPAGLTLSKAGTISGKPKKAQTKKFTVEVRDASAPKLTATRSYTLTDKAAHKHK